MSEPAPEAKNKQVTHPEFHLIDNWLKVQEEYSCFTEQVTVMFPLEHPKAAEMFGKLLMAMTEAFGGATTWTGYGTWCNTEEGEKCTPDKQVAENIAVLQAAHKCSSKAEREIFSKALKEALLATDQAAAGIISGNKFFMVPVSKLRVDIDGRNLK